MLSGSEQNLEDKHDEHDSREDDLHSSLAEAVAEKVETIDGILGMSLHCFTRESEGLQRAL